VSGVSDAPTSVDICYLLARQNWLVRAAHLPGRTLHLAVVLHLLAVGQRTAKVELGNIATLEFGLDRSAKYRTLAWLEKAGLVRVERRRGRPPIVTLLQFNTDQCRVP
jgi:DNA-binding transcriptional ArsR family regulator